jgi:hypothetical protein
MQRGALLMPRSGSNVTQADIARMIRAVKAAGLPIVRVVMGPDGVAIVTAEADRPADQPNPDDEVAEREPMVLL